MEEKIDELRKCLMGKDAVDARNKAIYILNELSKISLKTNKTLSELNHEDELIFSIYLGNMARLTNFLYNHSYCRLEGALKIEPEIQQDYNLILQAEGYTGEIDPDCDKPIRAQIDDLQIHFGYLEVILFLFFFEITIDFSSDDVEWAIGKIMSVKTEFNSKLNKILDDHNLDNDSKLSELEGFFNALVYLNENFHFYGDLRSEIGTLKDAIKKLKEQNDSTIEGELTMKDLERELKREENSSNRVQPTK